MLCVPTSDFGPSRPLTLWNSLGLLSTLPSTLQTHLGLCSALCLALVPVTGLANVQQTGTLGANPYLPTGYVLSTWWVLKQNTQHEPTGSILINFTFCPHFAHPDIHWAHVEYFYKVPTQVPTNRRGGYIQKVPIKNPVGKC